MRTLTSMTREPVTTLTTAKAREVRVDDTIRSGRDAPCNKWSFRPPARGWLLNTIAGIDLVLGDDPVTVMVQGTSEVGAPCCGSHY